jgi:putative ABC transport system permease protein
VTPLHLLRRSLGRGRLVAVLLAVVSGLAAAYVVAVPRHASTAADAAVGDTVSAANVRAREIGLSITPRPAGAPALTGAPGPGAASPFDRVDRAVRDVMGPDVEPLLADPSWAAQSDPLRLARDDGSALSLDTLQAVLRVQSGLDERVRWVSGSAPGEPTRERTVGPSDAKRTVRVVPVALAEATAARWGIAVGDRLDLVSDGGDVAAAVDVTGTYEALDPPDGFWQVEPRLTGIAAIPDPLGGVVQEGSLVASTDAYAAVSDSLWRVGPGADSGAGSPALDHSWRYPLDPAALTSEDVPALRALLVRLDGDVRLRDALPQPLRVTTGLGAVLDRYDASVGTTAVMTSFATAGVTALAVLVLALTALVGVARRREEVRMLRARGASVPLVCTLLAVEVLLVAVPVAVLAVVVVLVLVPGHTPAAAWVEAALVLLVPVVTVVVGAAQRVRALDRPAPSDADTTALVRTVRRVVAELAVVTVAVLAVTTVRSRGPAIAAGTTDWFAALAPTLVALAASVVVVRLVPIALRQTARWAARRRGLVGFVGLARAARTGATAVLPVVTVVVGATAIGLLAATTATVADQREVAAYRSVGADARVDAVRLDPRDVEALAARPGVRAVAEAYTDSAATARSGSATREVLLLAVDPTRYAEVLRGTPLELRVDSSTPGGGALPALTSPGAGLVDGSSVVTRRVEVPVRTVAEVPGLDRVVAGRSLPVVLVPLDALQALVPAAQPDTAYVATDGEGARDLAATPLDELTPGSLVTGVVTAQGVADDVAGLALPALVSSTYLAAAALAAALTLLAVLLVLAATHDERTTLVVRLRTLGLPRGRDRALAWTEVLPVVVVAALAGGLVGALAPWLVADALDLAPFTGAAVRVTVDPRPLVALAAAATVTVLAAIALLLDALAARRGALADHLRRGAAA